MANNKTYSATSLRVPPIEFTIDAGPEGTHTFRVPRKPRTDVVHILAQSVQTNEQGQRVYPNDVIRRAMILMIANEVWVEGSTSIDDGGGETVTEGEWVEVDDKIRFIDLMNSPRIDIDVAVLGEICWDLIGEITAHPTGAPRP